MTYREYLRGDPVVLSIAPTGHREPDEQTTNLPRTGPEIAEAVTRAGNSGASVAHLHGRDAEGYEAPSELPAIADELRERSADLLIEYAVGPSQPLGDYLDVIDEGPHPDIAQVRVGPQQYGSRGVSSVSRRDVDRFVEELNARGVKPNFAVSSGRDLDEVSRLRKSGVLESDPLVTLKFGPQFGTVATPQTLLALLDAAPSVANVLVSAAGPNQFPLTTIALFLGAHVRVGMEDNLYLDTDTPVQDNTQLLTRVNDVIRHSQRDVASVDDARQILSLEEQRADISA